MNDFSNASKTILDFLTLLEFEQAKETSVLFNAAIWQDINQLNLNLNSISKPNKIALAILDWCENYPDIEREFKTKDWSSLRGDIVGDDDIDIPLAFAQNQAEIILNRERIQKVIQENQEPLEPDLPCLGDEDPV